MVGVAVKVTEVPAQIGPAGLAAILTLGVTLVFTTMLMALLVAVLGEEHAKSLVKIHVTISPLLSVLVVKVLLVLLAPWFELFTLHW